MIIDLTTTLFERRTRKQEKLLGNRLSKQFFAKLAGHFCYKCGAEDVDNGKCNYCDMTPQKPDGVCKCGDTPIWGDGKCRLCYEAHNKPQPPGEICGVCGREDIVVDHSCNSCGADYLPAPAPAPGRWPTPAPALCKCGDTVVTEGRCYYCDKAHNKPKTPGSICRICGGNDYHNDYCYDCKVTSFTPESGSALSRDPDKAFMGPLVIGAKGSTTRFVCNRVRVTE